VKVTPDERRAEVRAVGAYEWGPAVAEIERDLHQTSDGKS
jgi:hypothetical protein